MTPRSPKRPLPRLRPRPWTAVAAALLALLAGVTLTWAAPADKPEPPKGTPEQRQTIETLRNVGTAMWVWFDTETKSRGIERLKHQADTVSTSVDVNSVPVISAKDLSALLVPKYIERVPETDGWGHPVEYRLNTKDLQARQMMAIRSSGSDGSFAGETYEVGPFDPDDLSQDTVWTDGYFSRWPQRKQG